MVSSFVHNLEVRRVEGPVLVPAYLLAPASFNASFLDVYPLHTCMYSQTADVFLPPSRPIQVLEADTGAEAVGWPAFHKSTVHTSPLLYDIDFDGEWLGGQGRGGK